MKQSLDFSLETTQELQKRMTRKRKVIVSALIMSALIGAAALGLGWMLLSGSESPETADNLAQTAPRAPATGPLRVNPENPRYFTDGSGKTIYLTGSHTWNNLQEISKLAPKFEYDKYLQFLQKANHNFIRLWAIENAAWEVPSTDKVRTHPLPYRRTGPGVALDGDPKFDLAQFDPDYFDRLRSRVSAAADHGIYVSVMLFNGWCIGKKPYSQGNPWRGHPFHRENNVNGIDGDLNGDGEGKEIQTLQDPKITGLQEQYVRKVVDTLSDFDNVLWEISNESDHESKGWQYHMIRFIKTYEAGKKKQHPVGMTVAHPEHEENNRDLFESPADWVSPAPDGFADYRDNPPAADGRKVIILDTDHLWGVGGDRAWVWKSFTRGHNPIFMDPFEGQKWQSAQLAMGRTLDYAERINLEVMMPHNEVASSGYCLVDPGKEYLVYLPFEAHRLESARFFHRFKQQISNFRRNFRRTVTVDLTAAHGTFLPEWLNPSNGERIKGKEIEGGSRIQLTAPFKGDAVLHLQREPAESKRSND